MVGLYSESVTVVNAKPLTSPYSPGMTIGFKPQFKLSQWNNLLATSTSDVVMFSGQSQFK